MEKIGLIPVYLVLALLLISSCLKKSTKTDYSNGAQIASWESNLTEAIMVDMFSPPVASRIYSYSSIAAYESLRHAGNDLPTLAGRLNSFNELPQPDAKLDYDFHVAALTAFSEVAAALVYTKNIIREYEKQQIDSLKNSGIDNEVFVRSEAYGNKVAAEILKWSASDNFKQTRGMIRYTLLREPGSWEPTPPDFLQGAEPHWSNIRPFLLDSGSCFRADSVPASFSTDTASEFYRNAMELVVATANIDSNQRSMSFFWDDNPGVSSVYGHMKHINKKMTPVGHWMAITGIAISMKKLSMTDAAKIYAAVSVTVSDAFIACWDTKYSFQSIRPVTYIQRYISNQWQPILQTPPFPEYPSGHATISAAAATVLTSYLDDNFAFTDSSEYRFGLPVRSFTSFMNAAEECAQSRFYGGIHFMPSNTAGTKLGIRVAETALQKLPVKKVL